MLASGRSWFLLLLAVFFSQWSTVVVIKLDLLQIRYHFTPCGSTGYDGPTFDQCETYYQEYMSPIATDGVLFQFDEEYFRGGQGFRIPREDVYNVTIAGAAGGRGLCNIHFGWGRRVQFQIQLTPDYELLVMAGQKGQSPCDNPSSHPLCHSPPINEEEAYQCNQTWYDATRGSDLGNLVYNFSGGGGGGGASMLRARDRETGHLLFDPIVVAGGGGGTAAILNYNDTANLFESLSRFELDPLTSEQLLYEYHIDAKDFYETDIFPGATGARGYRPPIQGSDLSGAGGGWSSALTTSSTDGRSLSQTVNFAQGGFDCDRLVMLTGSTGEVDGGFGGGGGECGGGGGGGGYTGGAILGYNNDIPGGGGHSVVHKFTNVSIVLLSSLEFSYNNGDGYVDIVPANCNCTGSCAVNDTEDTFECFCPNNTTLAPDGFDCYYEVSISVNNTLEQLEYGGYRLQPLPFTNSPVELFSIRAELAIGHGSVCALVFLDSDMNPVAASTPIRESWSANIMLARVTEGSISSIALSEYTSQLTSSVKVIGAVLVTNGSCTLLENTIATNVSTRSTQTLTKGVRTDFDETLTNFTEIVRQFLTLPIMTQAMDSSPTTANPPLQSTKINITGLVTGLISAIVVLLLLLVATVIAIIGCNLHRSRKEPAVCHDQTQVMTIEEGEAAAYAQFGPTEQDYHNSTLKKLDLKNDPNKHYYHTLQKQCSSHSIKDDGYEVIDYEENVVCKLIPTTPSGTVIAPLYGIIAPTHDFTKHNQERALSGMDEWYYPRSKLIYTRELGEGQFGKVLLMKAQGIAGYKGRIPVAVKTLTSRDPSVISKFMEEADLMRKFVHANIVSLLGVCTDSEDDDEDNAPLMILEYMPYGDLKRFLESHKPDENEYTCIRQKQFHSFACDIASGLNFLAESRYVHRDVAARNCLVSPDMHIKLADFGLSRDIYEKDYYKIGGQTMLPVRWMAPESLLYGIVTTAADVWSYGVVLWEMTSYGDSPLNDMEAKDIVEAAQDGTLQHSRPKKCPDHLYILMSKCHTHQASERPTFGEILNILNDSTE